MQHLVVLDVVQQRHRHDRGVAGQEHRRAGHLDQLRVELVEEALDREAVAVEPVADHAAAAAAVTTVVAKPAAIASGSQPPEGILSALAAK